MLKYRLIIGVFCLMLTGQTALSEALYFNDVYEVGVNTLVLDSDDEGSDVVLQFGETLSEQIYWDNVNGVFVFTDDLEIQGTRFTLDSNNSGAGQTVQIVANQGADPDGIIQYDPTDSRWEYSNDGGSNYYGLGGATVYNNSFFIGADSQNVITHAADANHERMVQVKYEVPSASEVDNSLDFDLADESAYIQENAVVGTDFDASGLVKLAPSSGPTVGGTNLSLAGTATASSETNPAGNANDGSNTSFWYTAGGGSTGGWLKVDLGAARTVMRSTVRWYNTSGTYNCTTLNIEGSNDDAVWDTVWTGNSVGAQEQTYNFSPATYRYWRWLCVVPNNATFYVINEARLFEAVYSYPTTPYYVTTDANSLNTASWSSISDVTITQNILTNTSLRYMFSFDGGTTWKYHNGASWVASSLANLQANGMTQAAVEGLSNAQWYSAGGINSDPAETLDIAVDLYSSTGVNTPSLDHIAITHVTDAYWRLAGDLFGVRETSDTETTVVNLTGGGVNAVVDIWVP